jgi:tetratricopeptide (TPR) repeat protein
MLLDHDDRDGARTELVALAREVPDRLDDRIAVARLAERAGDWPLALAQYSRAARLDPARPDAFAGAGRAALAVGDLAAAERHLEAAVELSDSDASVTAMLAAVRRARAGDPLQPRLSTRERARRATAGLAWALTRLEVCTRDPSSAPPASDLADLQSDLLRSRRGPAPADLEAVESIVALIDRTIARVAGCKVDDPMEPAWRLILRAHGGGGQ